MRILLIEQDKHVAASIGDALESAGMELDYAVSTATAEHLLSQASFDVLILDGDSRTDGVAFCHQLRSDRGVDTPALVMLSDNTLDARLAALEAGADDVLSKSVDRRELVLRLRAMARRQRRVGGGRLRVADLEFDLRTLTVARGGDTLRLNPVQRRLLEMLMRNTDRVVRREELQSLLRQSGREPKDALRVHIHGLRATIDKPYDQPLLQTIHGIGYRLHATPDS